MITCKTCKIPKKPIFFYASKSTTSGYYYDCIGCHKEKAKKHQKNYPRPKYNRIKEVMKEKNVKTKDLAVLLDLSYITTAKYAANQLQPSVKNLFKIAELFRVKPQELLYESIQ